MPAIAAKLSPAQRSAIRRAVRPRENEAESGELNVVPFLDILMNVLMFVLATIALSMTATIATSAVRARAGPGARSLGLSVLVVPGGFSVKTAAGSVAPGCASAGAGITIAKRDGEYDFAALSRCAARLKSASQDFADERAVTLSANPEIPYDALIGAMDALRKTDDGEALFPDVRLGVVR